MAKVSTDKEVIKKLGVPEVAAVLGYTEHAVTKWLNSDRGIPWKARAKVQALAKKRRVPLPGDFAEERRPA